MSESRDKQRRLDRNEKARRRRALGYACRYLPIELENVCHIQLIIMQTSHPRPQFNFLLFLISYDVFIFFLCFAFLGTA